MPRDKGSGEVLSHTDFCLVSRQLARLSLLEHMTLPGPGFRPLQIVLPDWLLGVGRAVVSEIDERIHCDLMVGIVERQEGGFIQDGVGRVRGDILEAGGIAGVIACYAA